MTNRSQERSARSPDNELRFFIGHWSFVISLIRSIMCNLSLFVCWKSLSIPEKSQQQPEHKHCRSAEGCFVITTHQHVFRKMVHLVRPGLHTSTVHLTLSPFHEFPSPRI